MSELGTKQSRLKYIAAIYALGGMSVVIYVLQLQYTNSYAGFIPIDFNMFKVSISLLLGAAIGLTIPQNASRPSDLFILFYAVFVLVSYVFFRGIAVDVSNGQFLFHLGLLALPYVGALMLQRLRWSLPTPFNINSEILLGVVVAIVAVAMGIAIASAGDVGSLSIDNVYERRMVGRETFQVGSITNYLSSMAMNGLNPFLAFLAGFLNRKWLFALSILFGLSFFYSIGVKAPMAMVGLSFVAGMLARGGGIGRIFMSIVYICAFLFVIFAVEFFINGYSEVAEYFFRRIFVVPGFIVQYYMKFMFDSGGILWSAWDGVNDATPITLVIGDEFLGSIEANANTNAFIYALADGGYPIYFVIVALVLAFFKVLDALYDRTGNAGYLYIGFLYTLLVAEQAATTAVLSSGVALLFGFVVLSGKGWARPVRGA